MRCRAVWCNAEVGKSNPSIYVPHDGDGEKFIEYRYNFFLRLYEGVNEKGSNWSAEDRARKDAQARDKTGRLKTWPICRCHILEEDRAVRGDKQRVVRYGGFPQRPAFVDRVTEQRRVEEHHASGRIVTRRRSYSAPDALLPPPPKRCRKSEPEPRPEESSDANISELTREELLALLDEYKARADEANKAKTAAEAATKAAEESRATAQAKFDALCADLAERKKEIKELRAKSEVCKSVFE